MRGTALSSAAAARSLTPGPQEDIWGGMARYGASPHPWEGHGAGRSFRRMYVNETTASVQWYAWVAFKNVPDLNKNKPDNDRERWTAFQSCLLLHVGNVTAWGGINARSATPWELYTFAVWFERIIFSEIEAICTKKAELLFHVLQPLLRVPYKSGCCCTF